MDGVRSLMSVMCVGLALYLRVESTVPQGDRVAPESSATARRHQTLSSDTSKIIVTRLVFVLERERVGDMVPFLFASFLPFSSLSFVPRDPLREGEKHRERERERERDSQSTCFTFVPACAAANTPDYSFRVNKSNSSLVYRIVFAWQANLKRWDRGRRRNRCKFFLKSCRFNRLSNPR